MTQYSSFLISRRALLAAGGSAFAGVVLAWRDLSAAPPPKEVTIVEFSDAGVRGSTVRVPKIEKKDSEWLKQLPKASYWVTRREDTEEPFSGSLLNNHEVGLYRCICCDTALFASETKYESRTGWPSFWAPIAEENIVRSIDSSFGMERIGVSCKRCDAHLGHLFPDGPRPTGLRYCMNSVSLRFVKRA
jgi:peptide-methionine (R)-S-oxide reductase